MPITLIDPETRIKATRTLNSIAGNLQADRAKVLPYESLNLSWDITVRNPELPLNFKIAGSNRETAVNRSGRLTVTPMADTRYYLIATCATLSKAIGSVLIDVDTSSCISGALGEDTIRNLISSKVDGILNENKSVSRRKDDYVEIEKQGLTLKLFLKAAVDDWFDPDININALIRFYVQNKEPQFNLVTYDLDFDFPWYADLVNLSLFPAWLSILIAEDNQEASIKQKLITSFKDALYTFKASFPDHNTLKFQTEKDSIRYSVCPKVKPRANDTGSSR